MAALREKRSDTLSALSALNALFGAQALSIDELIERYPNLTT
jgi:hypothetical protein